MLSSRRFATPRRGVIAASAAVLGMALASAPAWAQRTEPVSESQDRQAEGGPNITTGASCISGDGSTVGFYSEATNLATGDRNQAGDLFVSRRGAGGVLVRANVSADNTEANRGVVRNTLAAQELQDSACGLNSDGSLIVFASDATNLVPGDTGDNIVDVFVRNLDNGEVTKISAGGNRDSVAPAISGNGRFVAFLSSATTFDSNCSGTIAGDRQVFLADIRDLNNIDIECISVNQNGSAAAGTTRTAPSLSNSGNTVVFDSTASNLAAGDGFDGFDVFLFDRNRPLGDPLRVRIISLTSNGQPANGPSDNPAVSGDGLTVVFTSFANNLIQANDSNNSPDIFVYNRANGGALSNQRANLTNDGRQAISNDFRAGLDPEVSLDGRYITFVSDSGNLVGGDNNGERDIFVRDRVANTTRLITAASGSGSANGASFRPVISDDGQFIVYDSVATNLVPPGLDTNNGFDVYITDQFAPPPSGSLFSDDFEDN